VIAKTRGDAADLGEDTVGRRKMMMHGEPPSIREIREAPERNPQRPALAVMHAREVRV
jgi:hypothetical protein